MRDALFSFTETRKQAMVQTEGRFKSLPFRILKAQRFGRAGTLEHSYEWEELNSEEKPDGGGMRKAWYRNYTRFGWCFGFFYSFAEGPRKICDDFSGHHPPQAKLDNWVSRNRKSWCPIMR
jgi:hypothetical protein